ncbi:MAG TPA: glycosyltransferase [Gemmatimonadaceae bacterium]|nr:glycosyltransferase [Gemmatimonadaceae bacterium]
MNLTRPLATPLAGEPGASYVVHSHLRWDFVWQRPQQLLSRLARRGPVLFVEEPVHGDDVAVPRLDMSQPHEGILRAVPRLPEGLRGRYDESIAVVRDLLIRQLADDGPLGGRFDRPVHWFYTPMPAPAMIGAFDERIVVYDCMDELSKFRFAPTELIDRERYLLAEADVVFTGGHKLMQSKARYHENVHFFGCGVDVAHFASARTADVRVPSDVASLAGPVLGYYGVIDERLDYDLLRTLAAELPEMQVVMVGPVVKVDPAELPQASNLHWLGQRDYAELPAYLKGFDVCLMPFALNEATEYINPTKTLEYMAGGKPIVSTPIADVLHHFTPVVAVARSPEEFVAAVRQAAVSPDDALLELGLEQASHNSWSSIVSRMERILQQATQAAEAPRLAGSRRAVERVTTAPAVTHRPRTRAPALNVTAEAPES